MLSSGQCLSFKIYLKTLLIWGANELLTISQYILRFILYIHLLFIISVLIYVEVFTLRKEICLVTVGNITDEITPVP